MQTSFQNTVRIDQVLPSFGYYDAIGIETRNMRDLLRAKGISSDIYSLEGVCPGQTLSFSDYAASQVSSQRTQRFLIHHFSIGSLLPYYLMDLSVPIVTRYHNITPAKYFPYEHMVVARNRCMQGRGQFSVVRRFTRSYWAASTYNATELQAEGFTQGCVLPLMRNFELLTAQSPCAKTKNLLQQSSCKTILFVGRVMPNKAHHDLLFYLHALKKYAGSKVRLICVGGYDSYYAKTLLQTLASDLGLSVAFDKRAPAHSDVVFTGGVSDAELVSFYQHADAFVSMSDHEGFCAPLVEAMFFGLPILANRAAAVPETLGSAGVLVDKTDPVATLESLLNLLYDSELREKQKALSMQRAQDFNWQRLTALFDDKVEALLQGS